MMFDLIDPLATMFLLIAAIFLLMAVAYGRR
jgi:hypothetical protein